MSKKNNRPRGPSVGPSLSPRCAKALQKYLLFTLKQSTEKPGPEEVQLVRSFTKNLGMEIEWFRKGTGKYKRNSDKVLRDLIKEQHEDMAETGHGE